MTGLFSWQRLWHGVNTVIVKKQLKKEPQTWTQLNKNIELSKPALSRILVELQVKGDVERIPILVGRRGIIVYKLSASGSNFQIETENVISALDLLKGELVK